MRKRNIDVSKFTSLIALVVLIVISAILSGTFLKPVNILNVLRQICTNGVASCGAMFAILLGGIDLTVGSLFGLTGVLAAVLMQHMPWYFAVLILLVGAAALGYGIGAIIAKFQIPAFIATLAGLTGFRGAALAITGAANLPISQQGFLDIFGSGKVPYQVVLAILAVIAVFIVLSCLKKIRQQKTSTANAVLFAALYLIIEAYMAYLVISTGFMNCQILYLGVMLLLTYFLLNHTAFGRRIYAVGGNKDVAKMAGINVDRTIMQGHACACFCAVLGGLLIAAKLKSGVPTAGQSAEMDAIAATVIGGTSLSGGIGNIGGTIIGVLLIGVLANLLSLLNVSSDFQNIFKGLIILVAVIVDTQFKNKKGA